MNPKRLPPVPETEQADDHTHDTHTPSSSLCIFSAVAVRPPSPPLPTSTEKSFGLLSGKSYLPVSMDANKDNVPVSCEIPRFSIAHELSANYSRMQYGTRRPVIDLSSLLDA
ncbi:hypothetical protein RRF57_002189 [Xylaria bambusicola]|uniref:Uncharacterized protein n=1 Tax=Xylaria bambusicola TaxID=326684 RepID=A0AAN7UII3_9PEZI